jgi:hypothetical protein
LTRSADIKLLRTSLIAQSITLRAEISPRVAPTVIRPKYNLVRIIYLVAIFVATLGWLWLIAWTALQLV